jgi:hypothetical protein
MSDPVEENSEFEFNIVFYSTGRNALSFVYKQVNERTTDRPTEQTIEQVSEQTNELTHAEKRQLLRTSCTL